MEKEVKKSRLFGLWLAMSLIGGLFTAGFLITLIWGTVAGIISVIGNTDLYGLGSGQFFVGLIAALLVFTAIFIIGTFKARKELAEKRKTNGAVRVLSIIYAVFLAIPAVIMLILFIIPLVELGIGISTNINYTLTQLISSFLSFVILIKMISYQLGWMKKFLKGGSFAICFTTFTAVMIALFMIFPGGQLRSITRDQIVVDDLGDINYAIIDYSDENNALPNSLTDLKLTSLNAPLDSYKYNVVGTMSENTYSYSLSYEICANFTSDTGPVRSYSFNYHPAGDNICFERTVYVNKTY